jgi:hypothetical protein
MGKHHMNVGVGVKQGHCVGCHNRFVGPGDRCQPCQQKLRQRRRRKPR